jgi:large subunit ribosomal protein L25
MATVELGAVSRQAGGKGGARQLRAQGRIPAVVYGSGEENISVSLHEASFVQMLRHISSGNAILDLKVEGGPAGPLKVLIKDVQRDPATERILHVDLQHVSMTQKVRVHVPIQVQGTAVGVKEGGILEHLLREIDIECLPGEIPEKIEVDVTSLDRGSSIHVRDLPIGSNLHVHDSPERVVVTVVGKTKEEEPAPAAAPAEAAGAAAAAPAAEPAKGA